MLTHSQHHTHTHITHPHSLTHSLTHTQSAVSVLPTNPALLATADRMEDAKQTLHPDNNAATLHAAHAPVALPAADSDTADRGDGDGAPAGAGYDYATGYAAPTTGAEQAKVCVGG